MTEIADIDAWLHLVSGNNHWRAECNQLRGAPMQVAPLPNPVVSKATAATGKPTSSGEATFGTKLAEAMSNSAASDDSKAAEVKKTPSKADAAIQTGLFSHQTEKQEQPEKQTLTETVSSANPIVPIPLPPQFLASEVLPCAAPDEQAMPVGSAVGVSVQSGQEPVASSGAMVKNSGLSQAAVAEMQERALPQQPAASSAKVSMPVDKSEASADKAAVAHAQAPPFWIPDSVAAEASSAQVEKRATSSEAASPPSVVVAAIQSFKAARAAPSTASTSEVSKAVQVVVRTANPPEAAVTEISTRAKTAVSEASTPSSVAVGEAHPEVLLPAAETAATAGVVQAPLPNPQRSWCFQVDESEPSPAPEQVKLDRSTQKAEVPPQTEASSPTLAIPPEETRAPRVVPAEADTAQLKPPSPPPLQSLRTPRSGASETKQLAMASARESAQLAGRFSGPPAENNAAEKAAPSAAPADTVPALKGCEERESAGPSPSVGTSANASAAGATTVEGNSPGPNPPVDASTAAGATKEERKSPTSPPVNVSADASATPGLTKEAGTAVLANTPAPASPAHETSEPREVPKAHQMLDTSLPLAPSPTPVARIAPDAAGELQMHVGIRTTAFGTVEIHTAVHQNQVGLAIQGERGLAHWFSTEVQNIEAGLKDYRLHLTKVELESGTAGLQTASSFHQQQPQRNTSGMTGSRNGALLEPAGEPVPVETLPADLEARSTETRVSILV